MEACTTSMQSLHVELPTAVTGRLDLASDTQSSKETSVESPDGRKVKAERCECHQIRPQIPQAPDPVWLPKWTSAAPGEGNGLQHCQPLGAELNPSATESSALRAGR